MSDFQVFDQMATENKDIRMSGTMTGAKTCKQGGLIEMGIDTDTIMQLITHPQDYHVAIYVINRKQFDEIKQGKKNIELKDSDTH